jgi:hypothetical protein
MMIINSTLGASGFFSTSIRVFDSLYSFSFRYFSRCYFW